MINSEVFGVNSIFKYYIGGKIGNFIKLFKLIHKKRLLSLGKRRFFCSLKETTTQ